jgi:hypothetical protein
MLAVIIGLASGCVPSLPASYQCSADRQCNSHGRAGVCELPQGACSFPDSRCASGKRYGTLDPPPFAGQCVPLGDGGVPLDLAGAGMNDMSSTDMASTDMATSKTIERVGTSTVQPGSNGLSVTLPRPTGVTTGDFLFVSIFLDDGTITVTAPAGWTVHGDLSGMTGGSFRATWLDHFVAAGDPTSYSFALSGAPKTSAGGLVAYRNVATPAIDVSMTTPFEAATFVAPSLTTTHANEMLLTMFVNESTSGSGLGWTGPTGFATAVNLTPIGMFDALQAAAGATGPESAFFVVNIPGIGAVDFVTLIPQP